MGKPLVSICIPTYNRVDALKRCVDSIVRNKYYNPESIEIVISDNCSTDETQTYIQSLVINNNYNILYNRNESNIGGDMNFIKVLSIAHGDFVKLHNDYSSFTEDGLGFLLDTVKLYKPSKTLLFFSIREKEPFSYIKCKDMNEFLDATATDVSWIGSYGFWAEDFEGLESKDRMLKSKFMQVDWILRLIKRKGSSVVCCGWLTSKMPLTTKHGGYNFVQLFTQSFPSLFPPYIESGDITPATFERLMKRLLVMLLRWIFRLKFNKQEYSYETSGTFSLLNDCFKKYPWYYYYLFLYSFRFSIKHLAINFGLYHLLQPLTKKRKF